MGIGTISSKDNQEAANISVHDNAVQNKRVSTCNEIDLRVRNLLVVLG